MKKMYKKGQSHSLSKNFSSTEFDCKCSYPDCNWTIIDTDHIELLQEKRTKWQRAVIVTSGYRCPKHNTDEGGATHSRHVYGDASDIEVQGMSPDEVANDCENFSGLGRYNTFTHVDSRPHKKARWDFRGK